MARHSHPFTQADLNKADAAIMKLRENQTLIQRCEAAGIPVGAHGEDCRMCLDFLEKIKREFFTVKVGDQ